MDSIRLVTLAPGHFHAALVQKRRLAGIDRRCSVYAPDDADLKAHLDRIAAFNSRLVEPADWVVDVCAGADWLERFERERVGNVVILSGQNRTKLDLMRRGVAMGLHVLADKPWIVAAQDYDPLVELLAEASRRGVAIGDAMTERHEITSKKQRELILDTQMFGEWQAGSLSVPALEVESVHYLRKSVDRRLLLRPWWWFDSSISGESIADVGTHLADLTLWLLAPEQCVDPRRDIAILEARRWPLMLTREQFADVTGLTEFPRELEPHLFGGRLAYAGNNLVSFSLRGVHVKLTTRWEYESPGGDAHRSIARGTKAAVEVRQPPGSLPELFVNGAHVPIPAAERTSHEDHFANVMAEFVQNVRQPESVPEWERANALAKYFITTQAVALAASGAGAV